MKKGMEENGQRTDPGTDGRQEQEDAVLRGQLQQALDSVEPDGEARERMLRRIREKAAARQTADEPTPVSAPEPARRRAGFWGQLLRYGLPTAACLCILMITLWRAPGLTSGKPGDGGSREPATTPIVRFVGPSGLDAAGLSLSLPEGAGNVSSTLVDGQIACVYFVMDGKAYALYASRLEGDFFGLDGDIVETEQITGTFSAILQKVRPLLPSKENLIPSSPGEEATTSAGEPAPVGIPGAYQAVWEADGVRYYLCATNGASADDVLTVVRQLMPGAETGNEAE